MPLKIRPNAIEQEFGPFTFPDIRIEDPSDGSLIHNISRTEVVFNEGGQDIDLRIEGSTNPNLLVINAGTNKIGIGTHPTQGDLAYFKSPGSAAAEIVLVIENPNTANWSNTVLDFLVAGNTKGSLTAQRVGATSAGVFLIRPANAAGAAVRALDVGSTLVVVNESGGDIDFRAEGDTVPDVFVIDAGLDIASFGTTLRIKERSAALGDTASYGQLWVKDDAPDILMFTDDAGTDFIVDVTPA